MLLTKEKSTLAKYRPRGFVNAVTATVLILGVVLATVAGCSDQRNSGNAQAPSKNVCDLGFESNLTHDDYVQTARELNEGLMRIAGASGNDAALNEGRQAFERLLKMILKWADATPPGGQKAYIAKMCPVVWSSNNNTLTKKQTAVDILDSGYSMCEGLSGRPPGGYSESELAGVSNDPELRQVIEKRGFAIEPVVHKNLCPQIPYVPAGLETIGLEPEGESTPSPTASESADCVADLGGRKGTISIVTGAVDCATATGGITGSYKQMQNDQSKSVSYKEGGVVMWLCRIVDAAESQSSGYDYYCANPMGSKVVVWNAE